MRDATVETDISRDADRPDEADTTSRDIEADTTRDIEADTTRDIGADTSRDADRPDVPADASVSYAASESRCAGECVSLTSDSRNCDTSLGRAYVYLGSTGGLATMPAATLAGSDGDGTFGAAVASAGDVNGDGFADLVIGAEQAMSDGRVYVYLGSAGSLSTTPAPTLIGPDMSGHFGRSVASTGDVNGDGFADLVVGADGALSATGRAFVFSGSAGGLIVIPVTTLTGPDRMYGQFGNSVANAAPSRNIQGWFGPLLSLPSMSRGRKTLNTPGSA